MANNRDEKFISEPMKVLIRFTLFYMVMRILTYNEKSQNAQAIVLFGSLFAFYLDAYKTYQLETYQLEQQKKQLNSQRPQSDILPKSVINISESGELKDFVPVSENKRMTASTLSLDITTEDKPKQKDEKTYLMRVVKVEQPSAPNRSQLFAQDAPSSETRQPNTYQATEVVHKPPKGRLSYNSMYKPKSRDHGFSEYVEKNVNTKSDLIEKIILSNTKI